MTAYKSTAASRTAGPSPSAASQLGADYVPGTAPQTAPAGVPVDGSIHTEVYDDVTVYWTAAAGVWPAAPTVVAPRGATSILTANGDGSHTHNDGEGTSVTIPAPRTSTAADSTGANYVGGVPPAAGPANPATGDTHTELFDDRLVTWTATGGAWPIAPTFSAPIGAQNPSTVTDGVNQFTHNDGAGNTTVVAQATVVANSAYEGTVTDTEGVTDTFISRLDDCEGDAIDPATTRVNTICTPVVATEAGAAFTYDTAAGEARIRIDDDCFNAHGLGPDGGFYAPQRGVILTHGFFRPAPALWQPFVTGEPAGTGTAPSFLSQSGIINIPNPTCEPMQALIIPGSHSEMQTVTPGFGLTVFPEVSLDGGATYPYRGDHRQIRQDTFAVNPLNNFHLSDAEQGNWHVVTIPAGGIDATVRLGAFWYNTAPTHGLDLVNNMWIWLNVISGFAPDYREAA